MKHRPVLLIRLRGLERSFVPVRIKLDSHLAVLELRGVESLEPVFLERREHDALSHLQSLIQVLEVLPDRRRRVCADAVGARLERLGIYGPQRAVQVVDAVYQIAGEALERKVLCLLHFAFRLVLEIAVFGYGASPFVLNSQSVHVHFRVAFCCLNAHVEVYDFLLLGLKFCCDGIWLCCVLCIGGGFFGILGFSCYF